MTESNCPLDPLAEAELHDGFCAFQLPIDVDQPRSIIALGTTDLMIVERGTSSVVLFIDSDGDGLVDTRRVLVTAPNLNHGLALSNGYLYASSNTHVYRWAYSDGFATIDTSPTTVIDNINADGQGGAPQGHWTRTLAFDGSGRLYVSVGSYSNVDRDSFRARIRRFNLDTGNLPLDFLSGEVFADGLRNEVGLAWDRHGVLWGVENGADGLARDDLGADIYNDNPAEELNQFLEPGAHYGYPYCWTEYRLPEGVGRGRGAVWSWPETFATAYTDAECEALFTKPALSMQAHSAPLGITFYAWQEERPAGCSGAFPRDMDSYAFIAFHGSKSRDIPTGYKVVYVAMDGDGSVSGDAVDLLAHVAPDAEWPDGFRPVDVDFDACGRLLVTSDGTRSSEVFLGSKIVRVQSNGEHMVLTPSSTPTTDGMSDATPSSNAISDTKTSNPTQPAGSVSSQAVDVDYSSVLAWLLLIVWILR